MVRKRILVAGAIVAAAGVGAFLTVDGARPEVRTPAPAVSGPPLISATGPEQPPVVPVDLPSATSATGVQAVPPGSVHLK